MKKHIAKFSMLTLCAAAILAAPASSRAQATATAPAAAPTAPPANPPAAPPTAPAPAAPTPPVKKQIATTATTVPFHGTITAVDTNAMTLTVEKRTFDITSETTITKDGKPAVLEDGAVGDKVRGAYKKNADGKLDAVTVHYGGNADGKKKESAN
jgi:hypothetical protein